MPEKKHRNPFEEHINSESFDVSHLGSLKQLSKLDGEMNAFFESLPDNLRDELWDKELDNRQKEITAYLATELAERIMREQYPEILSDLSDGELTYFMTVPVTLAMLAEQRLHQSEQKVEQEKTLHPTALDRDDFAELPANWGEKLNEWFLQAKDFLIRLLRRS